MARRDTIFLHRDEREPFDFITRPEGHSRNDKHGVNGSSRAAQLYDSGVGPFESFRKLPPLPLTAPPRQGEINFSPNSKLSTRCSASSPLHRVVPSTGEVGSRWILAFLPFSPFASTELGWDNFFFFFWGQKVYCWVLLFEISLRKNCWQDYNLEKSKLFTTIYERNNRYRVWNRIIRWFVDRDLKSFGLEQVKRIQEVIRDHDLVISTLFLIIFPGLNIPVPSQKEIKRARISFSKLLVIISPIKWPF